MSWLAGGAPRSHRGQRQPSAAGPPRRAARRVGSGPGRGAGRRRWDRSTGWSPAPCCGLARPRRPSTRPSRWTTASSSWTTAATTGRRWPTCPPSSGGSGGRIPSGRCRAASRWQPCADGWRRRWRTCATSAGDETVVVVAHVSPIKAAVTWALGVGDEVTWRLFVHPASISRIELTERGPVLHSFNEVAHLADLVDPGAAPPR